MAASTTTNPLLLALLLAVVAYVVAMRRQASPWGGAFTGFLRLAVIALAIRVVLFALLAPADGAHVLVRLPEVPLPDWLAGLRLGGPVAAEGLLAAAYDGLRLGVILAVIGAANTLTSPRRMLRALPSALYETGVALTVAIAFVPQAVTAVGRVRAARRLRGRNGRGLRALRETALPVLEDALERSVDLAAAMDARGFGRRSGTTGAARTVTVLTVTGLAAVVASSYGLLDAGAPRLLGVPLLVGGTLSAAAGLAVGRRRGGRTRHRPDPWRIEEWLTAAVGVAVAAAFVRAVHDGPGTSYDPLALPPLPLGAVVGLVAALMPAWIVPPVPRLRSAAAGPRPRPAPPAVAA